LSIGFVIGNGTSRVGIELKHLKKYGKIYACNAVYRTFHPDYLVAVDAKMVNEIAKNGYHKIGEVWTNYNKQYEKYKGLNYFEPSKGWSSGPTALHLASSHNCKTIYILGFDYKGIGPDNKRVNNVFSGSPNYKRENDNATYFGNWLRQTTQVIQKNPEKRYIRVIGDKKGFIPDPLMKFGNLDHMSKDEFVKSFNISLT